MKTLPRLLVLIMIMFMISCKDDETKNTVTSKDDVLLKSLKVKLQKAFLVKENTRDSVLFAVKRFTAEGKLLEEIDYLDDGTTKDVEKKMQYSDKGLEINAMLHYFQTPLRANESLVKQIYVYDKKNNLKQITVDKNGRTNIILITNDNDGLVSKRITRDHQNRISLEENYFYNIEHQLEKYVSSTSKEDETIYVFKYNNLNQNVERIIYKNNRLFERTTYTFNSNNQIVSESTYNSEGFCDFVATNIYYPNGLLREKNSEYPHLQSIDKVKNISYYYEFYTE